MWAFFCLCALPSSFVHDNKNISNSLENFLYSDLKRLNSVPRELSGSWIKLCGKILYLLPCCCSGRCWISFYWLVNLSFHSQNVLKSPKCLPLCRGFLLWQTKPRHSALSPVSSQFRAPEIYLSQDLSCTKEFSVPDKEICNILYSFFMCSISGICLYIYSSSRVACWSKLHFWVESEPGTSMSSCSPRGKRRGKDFTNKELVWNLKWNYLFTLPVTVWYPGTAMPRT